SDLRENTFFASVIVEHGSEVLSVDARPSDSIALALRAKAPIYVNEKLLQPAPAEEATPEEGGEPRPLTDEEKAEQLRRSPEKLNPEDFGKFPFEPTRERRAGTSVSRSGTRSGRSRRPRWVVRTGDTGGSGTATRLRRPSARTPPPRCWPAAGRRSP